MMGADPSGRGPLWVEFTRAQGGQAINHLARSFHLPRPKAKAAILSMLGALTQHFDEQTVSRGTLARLIELLGKNDYEQVLETPALMGVNVDAGDRQRRPHRACRSRGKQPHRLAAPLPPPASAR